MNTIIVQPLYGLSNRMRAIVGAASLAEKLHARLIVVWVRDESLNAKFSDLFEDLTCKVIECEKNSMKYKILWHVFKSFYRCHFIYDEWIEKNVIGNNSESWFACLKNKNIMMITCYDILSDGNFGVFKVKRGLQTLNLPHDTIGIHIRRTDNERAVKYSPTHLFVNRINEELKVHPQTKFYLATDDPEEESLLVNEFGESIIVYKKHSLDRNTPIAIQDALIDLYNLSRCKLILGSYYSSFSDVAALWGCVKKEVLMIK